MNPTIAVPESSNQTVAGLKQLTIDVSPYPYVGSNQTVAGLKQYC